MCQVVAAYMMVEALNKKGYNGFTLSVPSLSELQHIYSLAAPVFITMTSKVCDVLVHPLRLVALSHNFPTVQLISRSLFTLWLFILLHLWAYKVLLLIRSLAFCCYLYIFCMFFVCARHFQIFTLSNRNYYRSWSRFTACVQYGASLYLKLLNHLCLSWCMELIEIYRGLVDSLYMGIIVEVY